MANSKLLKEAIADAKAVRETAIANAKIALEEAFTPRLQSILSKKLQAEMEGEEEEIEEELDSSDIGSGDEESPVEPSDVASDAHTELGPESEEETAEVGDELEEGEGSVEDPTNADDATISEEEESEIEEGESEEEISEEEDEIEEGYHEEEEIEEEDELDLESIIRELEMGMEDEEEVSEEEMDSEEEVSEEEHEDEVHEEDEIEIEDEIEADEEEAEEEDDMDDEIDLDEILREMGYGEGEDEEVHEEEEEDSKIAELTAELEEALDTVKTLQSTINEVNLLNAKLLYANRLFRSYNLNNEQKSKVVENLDRTTSVREVKLVYATLAESMNFTGTEKKTKKVVAEAASKPVASTAPAKEIISENTNVLAERFKQLANIK
jgi:hypothetical protein